MSKNHVGRRKKIVILEAIHPSGIELIHNATIINLAENNRGTTRELALSNADAVIIKSQTVIDKNFLEKYRTIHLVARYGTGLDNIDMDATKHFGVTVINTPGENAHATAEFTIMLILVGMRRYLEAFSSIQKHGYHAGKIIGRDLKGANIGVAGYGAVGRRVAQYLNLFGCRCTVYSRSRVARESAKTQGLAVVDTFDQLLLSSDVLTLHLPLCEDTRKILNNGNVGLLPASAIVVNTSRGALVDDAAVIRQVNTGKLAGYYTDVLNPEPGLMSLDTIVEHELLQTEGVYVSAHIAGLAETTLQNMSISLANKINSFYQPCRPIN